MEWILGSLVVLALAHGLVIVVLPDKLEWKPKIAWYYAFSYFSFLLAILGMLGVTAWAAGSQGSSGADWYLVSLREFIWLNPFIVGTAAIACSVALVVALVEALWTNPFQSASRKPAVIWMVWFVVTVGVGIGLDWAFGDQLRVNRRASDLAAISEPAPPTQPATADPNSDESLVARALEDAIAAFQQKVAQLASPSQSQPPASDTDGEGAASSQQASDDESENAEDDQPSTAEGEQPGDAKDDPPPPTTVADVRQAYNALLASKQSLEEKLRSDIAKLDRNIEAFWEAGMAAPMHPAFNRWDELRRALGLRPYLGEQPPLPERITDSIDTDVEPLLEAIDKALAALRRIATPEADALQTELAAERERLSDIAARGRTSVDRAMRCASRGRGIALLAAGICGGLYYLWCGNVLYRRLTDRDRLVGFAPKRIAFFPLHVAWLRPLLGRGKFRISTHDVPAQAVVIGPRASGKTELLRSIQDLEYPVPPMVKTISTQEPVLAELYDHPYLATIIDCAGENMGDQFDILRTLRADCLVVVICAAHLKNDQDLLEKPENWKLNEAHSLFNRGYTKIIEGSERYVGKSAIDFFQALAYATKRAGTTGNGNASEDAAPPRNRRRFRKPTSHAPVQRVLVVLNDRDDPDAGNDDLLETIPIACLETLAKEIHTRFLSGSGELCYAAVKAHVDVQRLNPNGMPDYLRTVTITDRSGNLTVGGQNLTWNKIFGGEWNGCRGSAGGVQHEPEGERASSTIGLEPYEEAEA